MAQEMWHRTRGWHQNCSGKLESGVKNVTEAKRGAEREGDVKNVAEASKWH